MLDYSFSGGIVRGLGLGKATVGLKSLLEFGTPGYNSALAALGLPTIPALDTSQLSIPAANTGGLGYAFFGTHTIGGGNSIFAPAITFPNHQSGVIVDVVGAWANVTGGSLTINALSLQLVDVIPTALTGSARARPIVELGARFSSQASDTSGGAGARSMPAALPTIQRPLLILQDDFGPNPQSANSGAVSLGLLAVLDMTSGPTAPASIDLYIRLTTWAVNGVHLDG